MNKKVYTENPIVSSKKLLDLVSEFGKTAGYKINIQKSKAFLYTKKYIRNGSQEKNPICHSNKKKYLVINLTKEVKDLYSEN